MESEVTSDDFPEPARRPANARLATEKFSAMFGWEAPDWRRAVGGAVGRLAGGIHARGGQAMTSSRHGSTTKTLRQLYSEHQGKVSDKWTSYLDEYDRILTEYRDKPVRLLEIGVQNGGSLEIWSRYFPKARKIVGCDLDPACADLTFDDPRIAMVIGDANSDAAQQSILGQESAFEIIIDDGSHHARDIVEGFARYFPCLTFGGVYIAEDLHCSYWREYGGGLYDPFSSMAFFKRLADTLNHEHWGIQKSRRDILSGFSAKYGSHISDEALQAVRSVQFMNSICAIRKEKPETNRLQGRVIAGSVATVLPKVLEWQSAPAPVMDQAGNECTARATLPEGEFGELLATVQAQREQTAALEVELAARDSAIRTLQNSTSWRITAPLRAVSPGARRFLRNARRALKLARWLGTGQFRRVSRAILPYYQGYVRPRVKAMMPRRVSGALKRWLIDGNSATTSLVDCSLEVPLRYVEGPRPADGPVAAIVHIFYPDLAEELRGYLENIPGAVDLFISATGESERSLIESVFSGWSKGRVDLRIVPNRGRDWAPKLVCFRDVYDSYTYVLCLHTKRSPHSASLSAWRRFLLENLLGNEATVSSVFAVFERNPRLGIVAPPHFGEVRSAVSWGENLGAGTSMAARMGFSISSETTLDFPSGSMFWARSAALRPLLDLQLVTEDFEEEVGRHDGTLAHAIERLVFFACEKAGFDWIKVGRPELSTGRFTVQIRDERELDQFFERQVRRLLDHRAVEARKSDSPRTGTRIGRGRASSDIPRVAVCLIAKNEGRYLVEWMAYYIALGFDEILIYDNGSSDATAEIVGRAIANDFRIRYFPWPGVPGIAPQVPAYNDALRKTRADWIAFVDIDEFIVLKEHASIGEFLAGFKNDTGAVCLHWLLFGSSGDGTYADDLVMRRFKRCANPDFRVNRHVKSIVRPSFTRRMNVHVPELSKGRYRSSNGVEQLGFPLTDPIVHHPAQINHYCLKSREEYRAKKARGQADRPPEAPGKFTEEFWRLHDRNETVDNSIDAMIPAVEVEMRRLTGGAADNG